MMKVAGSPSHLFHGDPATVINFTAPERKATMLLRKVTTLVPFSARSRTHAFWRMRLRKSLTALPV